MTPRFVNPPDETVPVFPDHEWQRVTLGQSGDAVWRLTGPSSLYVKVSATAQHEADRLAWFADRDVPVPELVDVGAGYLVTRALAGRPASDPWPAGRRRRVIEAVADIAVRLHRLDVKGCPFDRRLDVSVAEAHAAATQGRVALDQLDEHRAGWTADDLVAELNRTRPPTEGLVVCHGDLSLPNVLIDPATLTVTGLVDLARAGVADRYVDLAIATRSIALHPANNQFGPSMAAHFLDAYGVPEPDTDKIAFYRLLDEFG